MRVQPRALVLGAGITGLCTAWGLVKRGWDVTVADRGTIPNPLAASWDHHRLIRPHYPSAPGLAARVADAHVAWDVLFADLSDVGADGPLYAETGVLSISTEEDDWTDRAAAALDTAEVANERLEPVELAERYPQFALSDARYGLYTEAGGALLSDRIIHGLIRWLTAKGVVLVEGFEAVAIDSARGCATARDGRTLVADTVVAAVGVGSAALLSDWIADPLRPRRSVVLYVDPPSDLGQAWARGPSWCDLGGADDHWGIAPVAGLPLKLGLGAHTRDGDEVQEREATEVDIATILAGYATCFTRLAEYRIRSAVANFWTLAPDEAFLIRRDDRLIATAIDSGHAFKFGAVNGLDLAEGVAEPERFGAMATKIAGASASLTPPHQA